MNLQIESFGEIKVVRVKEEKLVRILGPHINTQPNIYYHEGTRILDWAVAPTLPGDVHMPHAFWKVG